MSDGLTLTNGVAVPAGDIVPLPYDAFREGVLSRTASAGRIVSLFGVQRADGLLRLLAVVADDRRHELAVLATDVGDSFQSLTPDCPQAHLFEREVFEQHGVRPEGHPWLKPVRVHDLSNPYGFFTMLGQDVHEVAVGPVHAGVIEPGHFRFMCVGEVVHHLEIHLGYQHRGVEVALTGGPHPRSMLQAETLAGDTSVGHGTAYCQALEGLAGVVVPERGQALRAVALELERLANHLGDLGALANDVGFLPTAAYCGRLRGDALNVTTLLCGNRLGHRTVRPGGVAIDVDEAMVEAVAVALEDIRRDAADAMDLFFDSRSSLARLERTGTVTAQACRDLGIVGPAARASGVALDVRADHPAGWYAREAPAKAAEASGDVLARANVRRTEVERSIEFAARLIADLPPGPVRAACPPPAPDRLIVSMAEGWRGEIAHVALTDAAGRFARYKLTDPSFHNWTALAMALRGEQVSDFPLCNKSFNLSYCGFDL